ncbi:MAG: hypothetical protein HOM20_12525 [Porticoccaceae bacterium]|nr:hypothetical protein [Porticoccaceae bacterium]
MSLNSPFYTSLRNEIDRLGGCHNAHLHLDRINTLEDGMVDRGNLKVLDNSHISLQKKHALIATVHEGPAYDEANLKARLASATELLIEANTRVADTMVDVTDDRIQLSALETVQSHARQVADKIEINAAVYSPLGFRDDQPTRWNLFERAAKQADFIGALPEADDVDDYPENIGFDEHCVRMLDLARREKKILHVHTDQRNEPSERGTERLIERVKREGRLPRINGEPAIWAVHMISPSTYEEERFQALLNGMLECDIGLICCPSAALGMRQLRPLKTPTYNSIPRVLELAAAGVQVKLGSDNVADMCSPSTTADLVDEVFILTAALRFYKIEILAKFAAGIALDSIEKQLLSDHLQKNDAEIERVLNGAH